MVDRPYQRLPWQQGLWDRLQQARQQQRLPHAMLFSGPKGVGKASFADALAQSLLCETPDQNGEPCGQCRHCHLIQAGTHPDLQRIEPEEESKSGEIKIDMIRSLTEGSSLTATSGGYKVVIIRPAERMNSAAANSLLKTLEEPTASTLLILLTDAPSRLLATIRSRCQHFIFSQPQTEVAIEWLQQRVTQADPATLLHLAGGAPLYALSLDNADLLRQRREMLTAFTELGQQDKDPVKLAEQWSQYDSRLLLTWLIGWIMDMLRLQVSPQPPLLYNQDERQTLQRIAEQLNSAVLQRYLSQVFEVQGLIETNLNLQLLLEKLLLEWNACLQQVRR